MKEDIVFYYKRINYIGGIETWLYEIAKKYGENRNITVYYDWIAPKQYYRLSRIVKCEQYTGQRIECNTFIFCFCFDAIKTTKAKEYVFFVHADYRFIKSKVTIPLQTTKIYAVSQLARDSFYETHKDQVDKLGLTVGVLYNPLTTDKPKRVLTLISPTRLTKEKGGNRMIAMAKRLKEKGIPYNWFVYSDRTIDCNTSHFVMMQPELDIRDYIADADYLVQLSDTEAWPYSPIEAMSLGTPLVITELPMLDEMKIKDGENAFILKFDLSNLDEVIDKMYNNNLKGFKYIPNQSEEGYLKLLGEETKREYDPSKSGIQITIKKKYNDIQLKREVRAGEQIIVTESRYKDLMTKIPDCIESLE